MGFDLIRGILQRLLKETNMAFRFRCNHGGEKQLTTSAPLYEDFSKTAIERTLKGKHHKSSFDKERVEYSFSYRGDSWLINATA